MKFLKITTLYPSYIRYFYSRNPSLRSASYEVQKAGLDNDSFGWMDAWSHALTPLGYDVMEVNANVLPLQTAWAREHGVPVNRLTWQKDIATAQIGAFRPDIIFTQDPAGLRYIDIGNIKRDMPSVKLTMAWCGAPMADFSVLRLHDLVLSCIPELVQYFDSTGIPAFHLDHAFDPRVLDRIDSEAEKSIDFSFIGQLVRSRNFHLARETLLEYLTETGGITIFTPNYRTPPLKAIKTYIRYPLYYTVRLFRTLGIPDEMLKKAAGAGRYDVISDKPRNPVNRKLAPFMQPPVFGLEMYRTLQKSKVTLNSHIDISVNSASNMRLFEATGVGTCLLTDWKKNIPRLFEPDHEVVTYASPEECSEKVRWLLDNPEEREKISAHGRKRTLRDHTFTNRADILHEIIRKALG